MQSLTQTSSTGSGPSVLTMYTVMSPSECRCPWRLTSIAARGSFSHLSTRVGKSVLSSEDRRDVDARSLFEASSLESPLYHLEMPVSGSHQFGWAEVAVVSLS